MDGVTLYRDLYADGGGQVSPVFTLTTLKAEYKCYFEVIRWIVQFTHLDAKGTLILPKDWARRRVLQYIESIDNGLT